ncbi:MAG: hypothetical protein H0U73_06030 [Tatlockia sp.]|nr:hypothetical protein [Tatlockia sp.]
MKEGENLTQEQRDLLEIPAFFAGIAMAYMDVDESFSMLGRFITHFKEEELIKFLQRVFSTLNQYSQTSLKNHLDSLNNKLRNESDVAIEFNANKHSVGVRLAGDDQFELTDINDLELRNKVYNSAELAQRLNEKFFNPSWFGESVHLTVSAQKF